MQDARRFRAMATFYLDLARQISLDREADKVRAAAADYLARAMRLEAAEAPDVSVPAGENGDIAGRGAPQKA
jgi:hypothetical protein